MEGAVGDEGCLRLAGIGAGERVKCQHPPLPPAFPRTAFVTGDENDVPYVDTEKMFVVTDSHIVQYSQQ